MRRGKYSFYYERCQSAHGIDHSKYLKMLLHEVCFSPVIDILINRRSRLGGGEISRGVLKRGNVKCVLT